MIRPVEVEAREGYRLWLRFSDGVSGVLDLSHLVGKGMFTAWVEPEYFRKAYIAEHRAIVWDEDIELCPDALYMELTGKSLEELPEGLVSPARIASR